MSEFQRRTRTACANFVYLVMESAKEIEEARVADENFVQEVHNLAKDLVTKLNVIHEETKDERK